MTKKKPKRCGGCGTLGNHAKGCRRAPATHRVVRVAPARKRKPVKPTPQVRAIIRTAAMLAKLDLDDHIRLRHLERALAADLASEAPTC